MSEALGEKDKTSIFEKLHKREEERLSRLEQKKQEKEEKSATHGDVDAFRRDFNSGLTDIRKSLNALGVDDKGGGDKNLQDQFDLITNQYNDLKKVLSDSTLYLAAYHIKSAQDSLKTLWGEIEAKRESLIPRKRFAFKKTLKSHDKRGHDAVDATPKIATNQAIESHIAMSFFGFKDKSDCELALNRDESFQKDIQLMNLSNCQVEIKGCPTTVHINSAKDCTISVGPVTTSVFISDCSKTTLNLACQQLRIHSSVDSDFYIHVTSKAIIEDCISMRFGVYRYRYDGLDEDFAKSGLDRDTNHWDLVDDFNWLSVEPSPNWQLMGINER